MPLTVRLKAGERLIVNGAVLRNGSQRSVEIELLNHVTTLHERDLMLPEEATTPLKQLYFEIQMMHLENEAEERHRKAAITQAAQLYATAMQDPQSTLTEAISEVIAFIGERNCPGALRRLQKEIGKP